MRIVFIGAKGIPAGVIPGAGGVEMHVEQIATRLAADGHHVTVYIRDYADLPRTQHAYRGVHLVRRPSIRTKNLDTITHVAAATWHALFRPADIIHYHGVGPSTLALLPRLFKRKTKIVATFHSRDWFDTKWSPVAKWYLRFGEIAALYFPHRTIVISHVLQKFCKNAFGRETVYIPNGADVPGPQGSEEVKKLGLEPGKYLLGVGRLVPNKAYDVLIEAYREVKSDFPLVIAGDAFHSGAHLMRLKYLASQDSRVRLIGFQTGDALRQLFAHCYAFVHPSRAEGLSTSIIEAMAAGKLVIMSDIRENLELIDHSGLAFKTDDRDALREVMELVLRDPVMVKERGERARAIVQQEYSWDRVVDRLESLYKDLIRS
ncbi:glycosyltransferase [Candidatus Uhrbacteria bacterium]|nr:MAG: glycosyltransferase [Candidatus Uhrbacteria bacterium]